MKCRLRTLLLFPAAGAPGPAPAAGTRLAHPGAGRRCLPAPAGGGILWPCSSGSQSEPARSWSWLRKRRTGSSTTTSAPSTSCSDSCANAKGSPQRVLGSFDITVERVRGEVVRMVGVGQEQPRRPDPVHRAGQEDARARPPAGDRPRPQLHRHRAHPARAGVAERGVGRRRSSAIWTSSPDRIRSEVVRTVSGTGAPPRSAAEEQPRSGFDEWIRVGPGAGARRLLGRRRRPSAQRRPLGDRVTRRAPRAHPRREDRAGARGSWGGRGRSARGARAPSRASASTAAVRRRALARTCRP